MRSIKFRAWVEYATPDGCKMGIMNWDEIVQYDFGKLLTDSYEKSIPLMQYTGLKDNKGVEIYEGDIFTTEVNVVPDGVSSAHNISLWVKVTCTVVFTCGCFVGEWKINKHKEGSYIITDRVNHATLNRCGIVLGNIHENPELLKS